MSKGDDMNVLVMDVEGTDGRERGEDQVRSNDIENYHGMLADRHAST